MVLCGGSVMGYVWCTGYELGVFERDVYAGVIRCGSADGLRAFAFCPGKS